METLSLLRTGHVGSKFESVNFWGREQCSKFELVNCLQHGRIYLCVSIYLGSYLRHIRIYLCVSIYKGSYLR